MLKSYSITMKTALPSLFIQELQQNMEDRLSRQLQNNMGYDSVGTTFMEY
jgi:hypothetical protein